MLTEIGSAQAYYPLVLYDSFTPLYCKQLHKILCAVNTTSLLLEVDT